MQQSDNIEAERLNLFNTGQYFQRVENSTFWRLFTDFIKSYFFIVRLDSSQIKFEHFVQNFKFLQFVLSNVKFGSCMQSWVMARARKVHKYNFAQLADVKYKLLSPTAIKQARRPQRSARVKQFSKIISFEKAKLQNRATYALNKIPNKTYNSNELSLYSGELMGSFWQLPLSSWHTGSVEKIKQKKYKKRNERKR